MSNTGVITAAYDVCVKELRRTNSEEKVFESNEILVKTVGKG